MSINQTMSKSVTENATGYVILSAISMLYITVLICNAIMTNRYIGYDSLYLLGGVFISPFLFILDNIIAEIYGFKITRFVIFTGFAMQTLFALLCQAIVFSPHPSFFHEEAAYHYIFGPTLLRIDLSGFVAYITANLINSYVLTRWKVLLKGRKFWLRSLGSSLFSEGLYSLMAIIMIELNSIPMKNLFEIVLLSYLIKAVFSIILAAPAQFIVILIKQKTGIDIYDFPKKFTLFGYSNSKPGKIYE